MSFHFIYETDQEKTINIIGVILESFNYGTKIFTCFGPISYAAHFTCSFDLFTNKQKEKKKRGGKEQGENIEEELKIEKK